jgi:putative PIN family toxin of toxin-antitoxin system
VPAPLRVVVDPGVLVSAAIVPDSTPRRVVQAWSDGRIQMIVSPRLLAELKAVLSRHKFRRYLSIEEADQFVALIRREAELRADPPEARPIAPDPKDDYLLALASATRADLLISGDGHLTGLTKVRPPVTTPARLIDILVTGD